MIKRGGDFSEMAEREQKIPQAVIYQQISAAMNHDSVSALPEFLDRFYVIQRGSTRHCLVLTDPVGKIVRETSLDDIAGAILRYIEAKVSCKKPYRLDFRQAKDCARYWLSTAPVIKQPSFVAELSEDVFCFQRLPFDAVVDPDRAPIFSEFLNRCSNAPSLVLWIGSLFFEWSYSQQYVYMHGAGQDGKGSLVRLLSRFFGSSFASEDATKADSRFWTSGLIGKRLVVFPDCNNPTFPTSGLFKSLTGGDSIRIEPKGLPPYTMVLPVKFMLISNEKIQISSETADQRRVIYVSVEPITEGLMANYEENLWQEAKYILGNCKDAFEKHTNINGNKSIDADMEESITGAEDNEQNYQYFFDKYFMFEPHIIGKGMCAYHLQDAFFKEKIVGSRNQSKYKKFLQKRYDVAAKRSKTGIFYCGVRPKTNFEQNRLTDEPLTNLNMIDSNVDNVVKIQNRQSDNFKLLRSDRDTNSYIID